VPFSSRANLGSLLKDAVHFLDVATQGRDERSRHGRGPARRWTIPAECEILRVVMLNGKTLAGLFLSVTPLVNSAVGAEPPAPETLQFEVTPFLGYRIDGHFQLIDNGQTVKVADHSSLALVFDIRGADSTQYELFYGRQSTVLSGDAFVPASVRVEYLHIGGTVALDETLRLKPYLAGGLGITRLIPDSALGNDDTRFSMSLALGLRVPVSQHFSLRFEGRGFLTPINTDSAVFCHSDQSGALCDVRARGSLFFQFDFLAGATYMF
jgi:hypothetical protein